MRGQSSPSRPSVPPNPQQHSDPSSPADQDADDEGDDEAYVRKVGVKQGPHAYNKFNVRCVDLAMKVVSLQHALGLFSLLLESKGRSQGVQAWRHAEASA